MSKTHHGRCFCGAIEIEATGEPQSMGYCHCRSCRSWSAAPVNAFSLWCPEQVRVVGGREHLASFSLTENSLRQFCRLCGGHVMTVHPLIDVIDVYAATIPDLAFAPQVHVCYAETVLPMTDGFTKYADFPTSFGGTGRVISE